MTDFFIAQAHAEAPAGAPAGQAQGNPYVSLFMMVAIFVAFYFILIRPQAKRAKEHKAMVAALQRGDEVATGGGLLGRVTEISDQYVHIEIAQGVVAKIQRASIQQVLPKGTLKSA